VSHNAWQLYIGEPAYGSLGYENGGNILAERYLFAFLLEYASTLGLLDVALVPPARARDDLGNLWGLEYQEYFSRYDGLLYFRITALGAYCLGIDSTVRSAPVEARPVLRVLPNLEVAAIGATLQQGDRLALDTYATKVSDLVWRLDAGKLLAAVEAGRPIDEIGEFLRGKSGKAIPDTVSRLLADVADRCVKIRDRGLARLVECADPALAVLIANDSRSRKHCMLAGERHLVVPSASESAFRRALREIGYLVAMDMAKSAKIRGLVSR
jgi:hypothetical protein